MFGDTCAELGPCIYPSVNSIVNWHGLFSKGMVVLDVRLLQCLLSKWFFTCSWCGESELCIAYSVWNVRLWILSILSDYSVRIDDGNWLFSRLDQLYFLVLCCQVSRAFKIWKTLLIHHGEQGKFYSQRRYFQMLFKLSIELFADSLLHVQVEENNQLLNKKLIRNVASMLPFEDQLHYKFVVVNSMQSTLLCVINFLRDAIQMK